MRNKNFRNGMLPRRRNISFTGKNGVNETSSSVNMCKIARARVYVRDRWITERAPEADETAARGRQYKSSYGKQPYLLVEACSPRVLPLVRA